MLLSTCLCLLVCFLPLHRFHSHPYTGFVIICKFVFVVYAKSGRIEIYCITLIETCEVVISQILLSLFTCLLFIIIIILNYYYYYYIYTRNMWHVFCTLLYMFCHCAQSPCFCQMQCDLSTMRVLPSAQKLIATTKAPTLVSKNMQ